MGWGKGAGQELRRRCSVIFKFVFDSSLLSEFVNTEMKGYYSITSSKFLFQLPSGGEKKLS